MNLDGILNKKLFKLFGFPVFGWLVAMLLIFAIVYFAGKFYLDYSHELNDLKAARENIKLLEAEHVQKIDLLQKNYSKAKNFNSALVFLPAPPEPDIETLMFKKVDIPEGCDNELKKLLLYQSELEINLQRIVNKDKEIVYWLIRNVPEIGASGVMKNKDTIFVNTKKNSK